MGDPMPNLIKGNFSLNLGFISLGGELAEDDRQCAWELYTELCTRVAVTGKRSDTECKDFSGEFLIESLNSIYAFFQEARQIMRKFPVGRIRVGQEAHLGVMVNRVLADVPRPFLEKWHVKYRHWWENESNPRLTPMRRQEEFPEINEIMDDWSSVRWLMRQLQNELITKYALTDVNTSDAV